MKAFSYLGWLSFGMLVAAMLFEACLLPAEERVELDSEVGRALMRGMGIQVDEGHASVRFFDGERLSLWAQAPELRIEVTLPEGELRPLRIEVHNCMRDAELVTDGGTPAPGAPLEREAAGCSFTTQVAHGSQLVISPPDAARAEPFVFAVLSDVQRAVDRVHEIFAQLNQDPELQFVVSTGDLVDTGKRSELLRFQRELELLEIPLFSTVGNHEMGASPRHWHELFGLFNLHFSFKGTAFSLVDSGNATIDPKVYDLLDVWLARERDNPHVVLTHIPPLDPVGLRGGAFRSRKEAAKFVQRLGEGRVDALFLGHIHSYYAFSLAGVPSYISGGGGAIEERLDGLGRHYLRVRAHPTRGIEDVSLVRVD